MFRVGQGPIECNSEVLGVGCCGNCVTPTGDLEPSGVLPCSLSGENNCSLFFQH